MVSTDSTGKFPEAVSAESITASVPSRMAFATSEASARVGRARSIMLSSIWVAVITGLPAAFAMAMIFFCRVGTSSVESSTPRSPRATITPSASSRMLARLSMASRFSIFAMSGASPPRLRIRSFASRRSSGRRTNERATKSTPSDRPKARSDRSLSVRAGIDSDTPGRFIPLFDLRIPPWMISQVTERSAVPSTLSSRLPSSRRMVSPGLASLGKGS